LIPLSVFIFNNDKLQDNLFYLTLINYFCHVKKDRNFQGFRDYLRIMLFLYFLCIFLCKNRKNHYNNIIKEKLIYWNKI